MSKKKTKQQKRNKNTERLGTSEKSVLHQSKILNHKEKFVPSQRQHPIVKDIEYPEYICPKCGELIKELSSAIADKESGQPVHFSCILEFLKNSEQLKEGEEIIYIGNGTFAICFFENPKDRKKFKIVKRLEWEDKNKVYSWKGDIADLASKT